MDCRPFVILFAAILVAISSVGRADTFGTGVNAFAIPFVNVGDPGNEADTTGAPSPAGAVSYNYRIGKYEIPEHAIRRANAATSGSANPLDITLDERGPNKPATRVSWFEAAQFVNWLNEDKGATPAYKFDVQGDFQLWEPSDAGYNPNNRFRNTQSRYFLPSVDEWYKAAFYDPVSDTYFDFPNGSNTAPLPVASGTDPNTAIWNQSAGPTDIMLAGGASPFGTVGQGGNVSEWQEGPANGVLGEIPSPNVRARRGEDWGLVINPSALSSLVFGDRTASRGAAPLGFRVASIPEPSALSLLILGASGLLVRSRFFRRTLTFR